MGAVVLVLLAAHSSRRGAVVRVVLLQLLCGTRFRRCCMRALFLRVTDKSGGLSFSLSRCLVVP